MATEPTTAKPEKGFLSKLWNAHMGLAKYVGVFGIPAMFGFLPKAAVTAHAANPAAGLLEIFPTLWGMMGSTIAEFAIPGWSIILGSIGDTIGDVFNAVSSIPAPTPAFPAPSP